jgi:hypothetical protein
LGINNRLVKDGFHKNQAVSKIFLAIIENLKWNNDTIKIVKKVFMVADRF